MLNLKNKFIIVIIIIIIFCFFLNNKSSAYDYGELPGNLNIYKDYSYILLTIASKYDYNKYIIYYSDLPINAYFINNDKSLVVKNDVEYYYQGKLAYNWINSNYVISGSVPNSFTDIVNSSIADVFNDNLDDFIVYSKDVNIFIDNVEYVPDVPDEPTYPDNPEDNSGILNKILNFFNNFWDNLFHFFIPKDEQIEELKNNFENKVLNKFSLTAWSFNDNDLNYPEWQSGSTFQTKPLKPPILNFDFLGNNFEYDTQNIVDFLDTKISFGKSLFKVPNEETYYYSSIETGGLTVRSLLSALISLDMFILNIYLFNKFLSKDGA